MAQFLPTISPWSRRDFVRTGAAVTLSAITSHIVFPQNLSARAIRQRVGGFEERHRPVDPSILQTLALVAIDAAKAAGAQYAEGRVTRTIRQELRPNYRDPIIYSDDEEIALGVRVLVNGGWGFAASPYWHVDEAAALAREAVTQAKVNSTATPYPVEMGHSPVASGLWNTPGLDPFQVPIEEKLEWMWYVSNFFDDIPRRGAYTRGAGVESISLYRQERVLATTEGTVITQNIYRSGGDLKARYFESTDTRSRTWAIGLKDVELSGTGWELFSNLKLEEKLPALIEERQAQGEMTFKPVDVGRYDLVCDARTMANLVDASLGNASQLDRALGYEANAGGTSYLGPDPLELLGTLRVGSAECTVTADRSMPRGLATVKWDDEGVEPEPVTLIKDGILHDYQTTREQAAWLASYYHKQGRTVRSHGHAGAESALYTTQQCTPNLVMTPGTDGDFDSLVAQTKRGIAVIGAGASTDFQSRSGICSGDMSFREIRDGQLGAVLSGAAISFDSSELWKNLTALGGARSVDTVGKFCTKGEPNQTTAYSVSAPAGVLKNMAVIDLKRKA